MTRYDGPDALVRRYAELGRALFSISGSQYLLVGERCSSCGEGRRWNEGHFGRRGYEEVDTCEHCGADWDPGPWIGIPRVPKWSTHRRGAAEAPLASMWSEFRCIRPVVELVPHRERTSEGRITLKPERWYFSAFCYVAYLDERIGTVPLVVEQVVTYRPRWEEWADDQLVRQALRQVPAVVSARMGHAPHRAAA